jgi:hypothetical protein
MIHPIPIGGSTLFSQVCDLLLHKLIGRQWNMDIWLFTHEIGKHERKNHALRDLIIDRLIAKLIPDQTTMMIWKKKEIGWLVSFYIFGISEGFESDRCFEIEDMISKSRKMISKSCDLWVQNTEEAMF